MEKEDKCLAWFPAPYLELWEGEEDDDAGFQLGGASALKHTLISFNKLDHITVLQYFCYFGINCQCRQDAHS